MALLHNPEISKTRRIVGYVISLMASSIIGFSAMVKLVGKELMAENMVKLHMEDITTFLGIAEVICLVIYWIPKTMNIGFFFLCTYLGGVIASELFLGFTPYTGIVVTIFLYVGTMLRKPELSGLSI